MSANIQDFDKSYEGRKLYFSSYDGVLSTISREPDIEGYPFGSVTPFCLDRKGRIVILISDLAQHFKNISENSKVSQTIQETVSKTSDVQANGRLTYIGNAVKLSSDEVEEVKFRYIRYLPSAEKYFEAHSFNFYRIDPVKIRFIGGFGKIFWMKPEELIIDNPFNEKSELSIIEHMNDDHQNAMKKYLKQSYRLDTGKDNTLQMVGIDALGCDIRRDGKIYRIWFEDQVTDSTEAREQLTIMARK